VGADLYAQVVIPYLSGLPEDVAINTFAFREGSDTTGDMIDDWTTDLVAFYNGTAGTGTIAQSLSTILSRSTNVCKIRWFEIVDAGPTVDLGPLITERVWTLGAPAASTVPLPLEVAVCSSIIANDTGPTSLPLRRRRGRIYLGPLSTNILANSSSQPIVSAAFVAQVVNRSAFLASAGSSTRGFWSVWSRAAGQLTTVARGFVNNEFDTQRRRQVAPTLRSDWTTGI